MPRKKLIVNIKWLMVPAIAILFCSLFTFDFSLALAETSPLDKAQEDYSYQLTKYTELKDKYQLAKSSYLTFKTATSKNEAFLKTKDYLKQIDNVYKSYLLLVEERTNTVAWDYASVSRDDLHKQIEEDAKFFDNNGKDIDASQTLENLPTLANSIKQHVETITLKIAFDTLSATDLAQIEEVSALFHTNYKLVDDLVSTKIQDKQLYNNWKTEVDGIQNNLDKEMETLKTKPTKTADYSAQKPKFSYDTSKPINILKSTKNILREILKFL